VVEQVLGIEIKLPLSFFIQNKAKVAVMKKDVTLDDSAE